MINQHKTWLVWFVWEAFSSTKLNHNYPSILNVSAFQDTKANQKKLKLFCTGLKKYYMSA